MTESPAMQLDPTQNVRELVEASNLRMDDLRRAGMDLVDEKIASLRREADLRAEFDEKLRTAEAKRIDAILAASSQAALSASERATTQAALLAGQVQGTAETLRAQMATQTTAMSDRVSALERSSYEGRGKSAVADPMMAELVEEMKLMRNSSATTSGKFSGADILWKVLIGILGVAVVIGGLVFSR